MRCDAALEDVEYAGIVQRFDQIILDVTFEKERASTPISYYAVNYPLEQLVRVLVGSYGRVFISLIPVAGCDSDMVDGDTVVERSLRCEHAAPGDLFHIDAKRFARIEGVGHAIHGDRSRKKRGVGWEVAFVCVDDHTRLAYAEVLPAENAKYAVAFFRRALRWFGRLGIRCQRLLTDNAKCYAEAKAFRTLCEEEGILQSFTRPYTPKTNGKAERFIQTLKRRWAYRQPFRTSAIRAASLPAWAQALQSSPTPSKPGKETAHGKTQTDPPTTCLGPTSRHAF